MCHSTLGYYAAMEKGPVDARSDRDESPGCEIKVKKMSETKFIARQNYTICD